ncbi:ABC transporter permease [uncultured Jatrophihabitans sp.]|uniref:ABC transporter permease n=1 Tax=uncultured Jatrophihabitans sp. TaxID=1610747 RepID=UPI0035C99C2D
MAEVSLRSRAISVDRDRVFTALQRYGVYAAIVILLIVDTSLSSSFFSLDNLRVQLYQVVPVLVVALGMALVIGTEGVDLSVGAVIAMASALIPIYLGYGPWVAMLAALVAGAVSGLVAGFMVAVVKVQPIVATLSFLIGLRGLAVMVNGASAKPITDPTINDLGLGRLAGIPKMAWIAVVLVLLVAFLVRYTRFGRQLVAIGDNRRASQLAGLPVKRVLLIVYIISGVLAALAGILITGYGSEADPANYGLNYELSAITAVVVGGTPLNGGRIKVLGTVAGAAFIQLLTATLVQHNVANSYAQIVQAVIIVGAVYLARGRSRA